MPRLSDVPCGHVIVWSGERRLVTARAEINGYYGGWSTVRDSGGVCYTIYWRDTPEGHKDAQNPDVLDLGLGRRICEIVTERELDERKQ